MPILSMLTSEFTLSITDSGIVDKIPPIQSNFTDLSSNRIMHFFHRLLNSPINTPPQSSSLCIAESVIYYSGRTIYSDFHFAEEKCRAPPYKPPSISTSAFLVLNYHVHCKIKTQVLICGLQRYFSFYNLISPSVK